MELYFYSVETIANLNASAAFQIDSRKVFKDDVDICPVIIDWLLIGLSSLGKTQINLFFLSVCINFADKLGQ